MTAILVKSENYAGASGEVERVFAHTHITDEVIEQAWIDIASLSFDNIFDAIRDWCVKNNKSLVDHAIYRLSVEVDVEDD